MHIDYNFETCAVYKVKVIFTKGTWAFIYARYTEYKHTFKLNVSQTYKHNLRNSSHIKRSDNNICRTLHYNPLPLCNLKSGNIIIY